MQIPHSELKPETLRAVIEDYITREGTDYGDYNFDMEHMVAQIMRQLEEGSAVITYNEDEGSCYLNRV